jgi:hypothetical protein
MITTFVVNWIGIIMGMPVRIEDDLYIAARDQAKAQHRTIAGQIEFWAKIGRAAIDNPDLPIDFITESLISMAEPRDQATAYEFGN